MSHSGIADVIWSIFLQEKKISLTVWDTLVANTLSVH